MQMNENSLLAVTDPFTLLGAAAILLILAWLCAAVSRNTNDFAKSLRLYLPWMVVADILILAVLHVDLLLTAGLDVCGFIALALISNYYFYH